MRKGIACLTIALIGLLDVSAQGQTGAFAPSRASTSRKSTRTRSARPARKTNGNLNFVQNPQPNAVGGFNQFGQGDPLAAVNSALLDPSVGTFGGGFGGGFGVTGNGQAGAGPVVNGGLGTTDKKLIHGFDGDGVGELGETVGDINHPRVQRLHGGSYIEGQGFPVRKGEIVQGGNYIPGRGVIGSTSENVQGGVYTPGYGVTGSFDPRDSNRNGSLNVQGGTYVPGYGVTGSGTANGFGTAGGIPSAYGAGSLAPGYGGFGNSNYGAGSLANNFGGFGGIPSSYGAGGVTPGFGAAGGIPSAYGAGSVSTGFGAGAGPSLYGGGSLLPSYGASGAGVVK